MFGYVHWIPCLQLSREEPTGIHDIHGIQGKQVPCVEFKELEECRAAFAKAVHEVEWEWGEVGEEEHKEEGDDKSKDKAGEGGSAADSEPAADGPVVVIDDHWPLSGHVVQLPWN